MKKVLWLCLMLFLAVPLISQTQGTVTQAAKPAAKPAIFDPARDAAKDIQTAVAEAARTGKNVLIDVGGNWCSWCHEMERYFETHAELRALRDNNFVTVKVNWSPENKNEATLSQYAKIPGYPHLFVLGKNGALLHSQDTAKLEDGKRSYDLDKFTAFLKEWSPQTRKPHQVLGEMPFSYSYEETLNLARNNNKPIFAYFTFET